MMIYSKEKDRERVFETTIYEMCEFECTTFALDVEKYYILECWEREEIVVLKLSIDTHSQGH